MQNRAIPKIIIEKENFGITFVGFVPLGVCLILKCVPIKLAQPFARYHDDIKRKRQSPGAKRNSFHHVIVCQERLVFFVHLFSTDI